MLFRRSDRRHHAFTLVELLVVIAIIAILMAISLIVGAQVITGGKGRVTADSIRVLDSTVADFVNRVGHIPEATARVETDANAGTTNNLYPVFDGVDMDTGKAINTVALYLHQGSGTGNISASVATINPKFVRLYDPDGPGGPQPELLTVFDGWDRPIRYVHPTFDGIWPESGRPLGGAGAPVDLSDAAQSPIKAQAERDELQIVSVRRNFITDEDREQTPGLVGDSDGGICPAQRPYFYSPGEDDDPSTLDNNIYTGKPTQPRT